MDWLVRPDGDLPGTEPADEVEDILCSCWCGDANGECRPAGVAWGTGRPDEDEEPRLRIPGWLDPWLRILIPPTALESPPSKKSRGGACSGEAKGVAM